MRRIGVFGGTFDPVHIGHLAAAEDAAFLLGLEQILFIPNRIPPHKQQQAVTAVVDRVAMLRVAIEDDPLFQISTIELERQGPSFTLDTLRELKHRLDPNVDLSFLTGCDSLMQLHTWHEPDRLLEEFSVVILDRPTEHSVDWPAVEVHFPHIRTQVTVVHVIQLEISSSDIRQRVATGRPIRYYVPPAVEQYIRRKALYRERATDRMNEFNVTVEEDCPRQG